MEFVDTSKSPIARPESLESRDGGVIIRCAHWGCLTLVQTEGTSGDVDLVLDAGTTDLPPDVVDSLEWSGWHIDFDQVWCPDHAGLINPESWGMTPRRHCQTCHAVVWTRPLPAAMSPAQQEQAWDVLAHEQGWQYTGEGWWCAADAEPGYRACAQGHSWRPGADGRLECGVVTCQVAPHTPYTPAASAAAA